MATSSARTNERVMVFIDGSNLYHVLEQICGRHDVQFDKFSKKLANGRDLRRVYYYNIRQEPIEFNNNTSDQDKFLTSLYDTPYLEVKLGIWKQRRGTMVEKGVDVMLATDLVTRAYENQYDTAIVVSGDADFYPALQAVKDTGKHVELAAFDTNISTEAAKTTDVHIKLNKTYFYGLWMTAAQARARSAVFRNPEVSDEAASPNGEDKVTNKPVKTKIGKSSRVGRPKIKKTKSVIKKTQNQQYKASKSSITQKSSPDPTIGTRSSNGSDQNDNQRNIRRTPSRRRIGGTSTRGNGLIKPRPPALRNLSEKTEKK